MLAHRDKPIPTLSEFRGDLPPEIEPIFRRMLAKQPQDRQATMAEVIRDLEGLIAVSGRSFSGDSQQFVMTMAPGDAPSVAAPLGLNRAPQNEVACQQQVVAEDLSMAQQPTVVNLARSVVPFSA